MISEKIVDEFERVSGIRLPRSYRDFLLASNGGRPERDLVVVPGCKDSFYARIHFFFSIGSSYECYNLDWNIEVYGDRLGAGLLSIASTEGADKICVSLESGEIVFWDGYEDVPPYPIARNFEELIYKLYSDELSPHINPLTD